MRSELGPAEGKADGLRAEISSIKNLRKLSQRVSEGTTGELSQGFTRELKMLKNLGLVTITGDKIGKIFHFSCLNSTLVDRQAFTKSFFRDMELIIFPLSLSAPT